jgi:maleate isomerase
VLTPYTQVLNARIVDSLLSYEREVVAVHGLGITINFEIARVEPSRIFEFAHEKLIKVDCDCIFLSCTNFRAMEALPELRSTFDVPVITSNQTTLEAALALLDQPR